MITFSSLVFHFHMNFLKLQAGSTRKDFDFSAKGCEDSTPIEPTIQISYMIATGKACLDHSFQGIPKHGNKW